MIFSRLKIGNKFVGTVFDSSGIISVPSDLFKYNHTLEDVSMMFNACHDLTTIPSTLFENNTEIMDFEQTFRQCTNLSGNVPDFWNTAKWSNVNSHNNCFYECSSIKITNYNDIPSDWK